MLHSINWYVVAISTSPPANYLSSCGVSLWGSHAYLKGPTTPRISTATNLSRIVMRPQQWSCSISSHANSGLLSHYTTLHPLLCHNQRLEELYECTDTLDNSVITTLTDCSNLLLAIDLN